MAVAYSSFSAKNGAELELVINNAWNTLTSLLLTDFGFLAKDEARRLGVELAIILRSDPTGGVVMTSPYQVKVFEGQTIQDVESQAQDFLTTNPTYFISNLFTQDLSTERTTGSYIGLIIYNSDAAGGLANYQVYSNWVGAATDEFVKVSGADLVQGYLTGKLTAGANITFSILNPGANESLQINASGGAVPGGANTQVQINDGGVFYGDVGFTYDKAKRQVKITPLLSASSPPDFGLIIDIGNQPNTFNQASGLQITGNLTLNDETTKIIEALMTLGGGVDRYGRDLDFIRCNIDTSGLSGGAAAHDSFFVRQGGQIAQSEVQSNQASLTETRHMHNIKSNGQNIFDSTDVIDATLATDYRFVSGSTVGFGGGLAFASSATTSHRAGIFWWRTGGGQNDGAIGLAAGNGNSDLVNLGVVVDGDTSLVRFPSAFQVRVQSTAASTNSTTGSLVTGGGLGVAGAINVGDTSNPTGTSPVTGGSIATLGGISAQGAVWVEQEIAGNAGMRCANGFTAGSAPGIIFPGATATLGPSAIQYGIGGGLAGGFNINDGVNTFFTASTDNNVGAFHQSIIGQFLDIQKGIRYSGFLAGQDLSAGNIQLDRNTSHVEITTGDAVNQLRAWPSPNQGDSFKVRVRTGGASAIIADSGGTPLEGSPLADGTFAEYLYNGSLWIRFN